MRTSFWPASAQSLLVVLTAACGGGAPPAATPAGDTMAAVEVDPSVVVACVPQRPNMERASAYDSTTIDLTSGLHARICYGRPAMREREIFGGLVPYDQLWRTGANEPTTLHLPFAAEIAGVRVVPGHVSLYTIPRAEQAWTIIVNRATEQWGHESAYTPEVEAQEVGRGPAPAERLDAPVESFTIRWESAGGRAGELLMEWERTRVRIPFRALP